MTSNKFWISHIKFTTQFLKWRISCVQCIWYKYAKQQIWVYGNTFLKCVKCFIKCTWWIWKVWFQYLGRYNFAKTKCMLCFLEFRNRFSKFVVFSEEFEGCKNEVLNFFFEFVKAFFFFLVSSLIRAHCSKMNSSNTNFDCWNKIWECQIRTRIGILIFVFGRRKNEFRNPYYEFYDSVFGPPFISLYPW